MIGFLAASASADKADGESAEPVVCVTCSSEVSLRQALRHMDKCFQKSGLMNQAVVCRQIDIFLILIESNDPQARLENNSPTLILGGRVESWSLLCEELEFYPPPFLLGRLNKIGDQDTAGLITILVPNSRQAVRNDVRPRLGKDGGRLRDNLRN
ncbi:hypothetical protein ACTXT7_006599 [Hymenolepis weldensis]